LNYLHGVLTQPLGSWDGFYRPQSHVMNFALRYQLAFSAYAVAALSQKTPSYRALYTEALRGAIEKMLHIDVWGYWRVAPEKGDAPSGGLGSLSAGHVAVLISPHQRTVAGPPSDPIAHNNLQYSGHLSAMLGLYEKVSGDGRYDSAFSLRDPTSGVEYTYTHSKVAERIHAQMHANGFGGVCCEQGMAYVPCNNHAMASNTLHDALHGTDYREANGGWLKTVRDKIVLRGPALRGVFGTAYMKDLHMAAPVAFNFTDAWGLAFMLPFDRPLVRKLYSRFKKRSVSHADSDGAFVGSSPMSERMEISDVGINTGFGTILARGIGDLTLADAFARYSSSAFGAGWQDGRYFYRDAPRTLHTTALMAIAEAVSPGGADFASLFNDPPRPGKDLEPYVARLIDPAGRTGISQAEYNPQERMLRITLTQVGDPATLASAAPTEVDITVSNAGNFPHIQVGDAPPNTQYERIGDDILFKVLVRPGESASCSVAT
jgi:Linalool dehydratase/isomerase